jgi:hypothetical protein
MADNSLRTPGAGETIASDDIGGVKHQRVKISLGADGSAADMVAAADALGVTGLAGAAPLLTDNGGAAYKQRSAHSDALPTGYTAAAGPMLYNESTHDRQRGNTQGTLLASAARTAQTAFPTVTNYNARGVIVFLNVTVASGTGGLSVLVQGIDPTSGSGFNLIAATAAVTTTGQFSYELYPGSTTAGSVTQRAAGALPRTWGGVMLVGNASSYTYSVGYSLIV